MKLNLNFRKKYFFKYFVHVPNNRELSISGEDTTNDVSEATEFEYMEVPIVEEV